MIFSLDDKCDSLCAKCHRQNNTETNLKEILVCKLALTKKLFCIFTHKIICILFAGNGNTN